MRSRSWKCQISLILTTMTMANRFREVAADLWPVHACPPHLNEKVLIDRTKNDAVNADSAKPKSLKKKPMKSRLGARKTPNSTSTPSRNGWRKRGT